MDFTKTGVIFSREFPDARPAAMIKEAGELCKNDPDHGKDAAPSFEEMMAAIEKKYEYRPREGAEEKAKAFAEYAAAICEAFQIATTIRNDNMQISASMDIYYGWYGGPVKHELETLVRMADDFSLTSYHDKTDCFCISMSYFKYDRYRRATGEKEEW